MASNLNGHARQEGIEDIVKLAKGNRRGEDWGLNDDEVAFSETLTANDAVQGMGKADLKVIAAELVT